MRCIFCKTLSDECVSVEHIVPESLGNKEHVLPKGWVCDSCNNYFAREVEGPFLESLYGRTSRFGMAVANKRNRIPSVTGFHAQSKTKVDLLYSRKDNGLLIGCANGHDESAWVTSIKSMKPGERGTLYMLTPDTPDISRTTSRFIGKIALEVLAYSGIDVPGWNCEIVDKAELDELRGYVRTGQPKSLWPVHMRRIYPAEFLFAEDGQDSHQVLHEWKILRIPDSEYYVIVAIFGIEYTINLGGPELDGYHKWMRENDSRSPLY